MIGAVLLCFWVPAARQLSVSSGLLLETPAISLQLWMHDYFDAVWHRQYSPACLLPVRPSFHIKHSQQPSADRPVPCPRLQHAAFVSYQRSRGLQEVATILVCSSAVALAYNVVLSLTIRRLSSTGAAVLGIVKTLALLSASAVLLGEIEPWLLAVLHGGLASIALCHT